MVPADDPVRGALLRRGFALEYATLGRNVAGIVILAIATVAARPVVLAAGHHPRHSVPGIIWTAATAAAMFALAAGEARTGRGAG